MNAETPQDLRSRTSDYWLDLLVRAGIVPAQKVGPLIKETNELIAIFTTIVTKIKRRMGRK